MNAGFWRGLVCAAIWYLLAPFALAQIPADDLCDRLDPPTLAADVDMADPIAVMDARRANALSYANTDTERAKAETCDYLDIARTAKNVERLGDAQRLMAGIHWLSGETTAGLGWIDRSIDTYSDISNAKKLGMAYNLKGSIHIHARNFSDAVRALLESLRYSELAGSEEEIVMARGNLGLVLVDIGAYDRADALLQENFNLAVAKNQFFDAVFISNSLGGSAIAQDRFSDAIFYFEQSFDLLDKAKAKGLDDSERPLLPKLEAMTHISYADALTRNERPAQAREELAKISSTLLDADSEVADLHTLTLAQALAGLGETSRARDIIDVRLKSELDALAPIERAEAMLFLAELYKTEGDLESAYDHMQLHTELVVANRGGEVAKAIARTEVEFDLASAEERSQVQARRAEKAEISIRSQRIWLWILGLGLALIAGLSGALWFTAHRRHCTNRLLNAEVQRSGRLLLERDLLLREVNHRVKNNLQIVSSLMKRQSHNSDDPVLRQALKTMRARVNAMSLVHGRLYGEDLSQLIDLKDYIADIHGLLRDAYARPDLGVVLDDTLPTGITINADTAIPLGLIIAELVANAVEHAFDDRHTDPTILIMPRMKDGKITVHVVDNGRGISDPVAGKVATSYGMTLVRDLVDQIEGELALRNDPDGGLVVSIHFTPLHLPTLAELDQETVPAQ